MPVVLWILCTGLLASTILQTTVGSSPLWKSSPLVLFSCGDPAGQSDSVKQIDRQYKEEYAQLERIGENWRLAKSIC